MQHPSQFSERLVEGQEYYRRIQYVESPIFKDRIYFDDNGLIHLGYNSHLEERSKQEQVERLNLLREATQILEGKIPSHQERVLQNIPIILQRRGNERKGIYWIFKARINSHKTIVVVRQGSKAEGRRKYFWSVFQSAVRKRERQGAPSWLMQKTQRQRVMAYAR